MRPLEAALSFLDRLIERHLSAELNPLARTGALAVASLFLALGSGVLLLLWYSPSLDAAYSSLEAMRALPYSAQLVRSMHRYSSDACVLFALLHALRMLAARRLGGPRWLPWTSGVLLLGVLWLVGWLGYWLAWDSRARQVALGSAKLLDVLPLFAEPLSRSFLTDQTPTALFFFMIFLLHMLVPLAAGALFWLHLTRVSRPQWRCGAILSACLVGALLLLSLVWPAASAEAARMTVSPGSLTLDFWYLWPVWFTDRLGPGSLWGLGLVGGALLLALPWLSRKERVRPAQVAPERCTGCGLCSEDCPFAAISMATREGGGKQLAEVDDSKCQGCGVCVGACDPGGIGLPGFSLQQIRRTLEAWPGEEGERHLAFVCARAAPGLQMDESGRVVPLPGYRVVRVPCVAWVHPSLVERAIRRGARGVLMAGCGSSDPACREGVAWARLRCSGEREPRVRLDRFAPGQLGWVQVQSPEELAAEADRFRQGAQEGRAGRSHQMAAAIVIAATLATLTLAGSDLGYQVPAAPAELVVSFKHPGRADEQCRRVPDEELARLPAHMRREMVCERGRSPVRMRLKVDGEVRLEKAYPAGGLFGDRTSLAIERLAIAPGRHLVKVELGDTGDPGEWTFHSEGEVDFVDGARRVVLFERSAGFRWH